MGKLRGELCGSTYLATLSSPIHVYTVYKDIVLYREFAMESNRVYTLQLDECIKIKDTVQSLWDTPKNLQQEPVLTLALDFNNIKWFQTKLHI